MNPVCPHDINKWHFTKVYTYLRGEGDGNPLQCSCLENPMDGGAWWAAVYGVAKSRAWLSDFTFMHWRRKWQPTPVCLEKTRGRRAWWAAIYGVAQSQTRLKWLSSISSSRLILSKIYGRVDIFPFFRRTKGSLVRWGQWVAEPWF